MYSNESRFSLQSDSHRTLIWRAPGTCYHQENTIERHRYNGAGWLVWEGIIFGSRTDLYVQSVTLTGHIYWDVILEQHELWFQQDGATCHTARATIDLLKDTFGDRLISRFGPVNWPPRSCDLTPLDYFQWGYVKSLVYADKPQTLDHLEDNIRRVIADIRPQMLEKVIENWTSRLDYIRASRGSPMPEIIFRM
ncbi:transposable element Tcb1 transposase [Trichonephila clavipes]|nr:transposable element Tcb1 transposase [Trichonephila clavipes]